MKALSVRLYVLGKSHVNEEKHFFFSRVHKVCVCLGSIFLSIGGGGGQVG